MKLKTLKEIERTSAEADLDNTFYEVSSSELRQEAIKWIYEEISLKINQWLPAKENEIQLIGRAVIHHPDIQRWMNRFNITKEELSPKDKEGEIY